MEGESFRNRKQEEGVMEAGSWPWIIWGIEEPLEWHRGAALGHSGGPSETHRNLTLDPPPSLPEPAGPEFHKLTQN